MAKHRNRGVHSDPWRQYVLSIPDEVAASAARGQPVVLELPEPPAEHVAALMQTLGVTVEVKPVTSVAVNQDVKVRAGVNGEIVVMSAWCPTCKLDSSPNGYGRCLFCGTPIVDEDTLSATAMRAQITAAKVRPVEAPPGAVDEPTKSRRGWTRDETLTAIRQWADAHGAPPSSHDWRKASDDHPNTTYVKRLFGSWADAVEAAGFDRPRRGVSTKPRATAPHAESMPPPAPAPVAEPPREDTPHANRMQKPSLDVPETTRNDPDDDGYVSPLLTLLKRQRPLFLEQLRDDLQAQLAALTHELELVALALAEKSAA